MGTGDRERGLFGSGNRVRRRLQRNREQSTMGVWRRGTRPDLVGAVIALVVIVRCGLSCRKMRRAGIRKELGVF